MHLYIYLFKVRALRENSCMTDILAFYLITDLQRAWISPHGRFGQIPIKEGLIICLLACCSDRTINIGKLFHWCLKSILNYFEFKLKF